MTHEIRPLRSRRLSTLPLLIVIAVGFSTSSSIAQSVAASHSLNTRIVGIQDADVDIPPASVTPGRRDAGALATLNAFVTLSNLSQLQGIQGSGSFTDQFNSNPVSLTFAGNNALRIDVADPAGQRSIRIQGTLGDVQESNGRRHALPPASASGGFFLTPFMLYALTLDSQTSMVDQGIVTIGSSTMHRVTISYSITLLGAGETSQPGPVVDLYFDPITNTLAKSAAAIQIDTRDRARYLQVVSYSDYRNSSGSQIPFRYSVTLNGQPQWTVQLNTVSANPSTTANFFQF
jgi:hypothetical protein